MDSLHPSVWLSDEQQLRDEDAVYLDSSHARSHATVLFSLSRVTIS